MNEIAEQIYNNHQNNLTKDYKWSFHVNKYNEAILAIKDGWNYPVSQMWDDSLSRNKNMKDFYEYLGKRLEILLNAHIGLSNEELQERYKNE